MLDRPTHSTQREYRGGNGANEGRPALRITSTTIPGSSTITYTYASAGNSLAEVAGRVSSASVGATTAATYAYLGAGQLVGTDLNEPDVVSRLYGTGTANYDAMDRFGRVTTSRWNRNGATAKFYDVALSYDRGSNITVAQDNVQKDLGAGGTPRLYDASYTMDALSRLAQAKEGNWNGSTISTTSRDERWTLSQPGNWARHKLDLDGDGVFTGTDELDDTRTHNTANELTARDTDSNSSNNYTLTYDAAGNLTDDGKDYKYIYNAWGRLRQVKKTSNSALVAEYWYNGLKYRIGWKYDTDADGDVDGSDKKYWFCHDVKWRIVATFLGTDSDAKERFFWHNAGRDGKGVSSYIDSIILRDKDANTAWTASSDGALEERRYFCQNWRADVSAVVKTNGNVVESIKYSAYGVPTRIDPSDYNRDGFSDASDSNAFDTDWLAPNARADVNFDDFVDSIDYDLFYANWNDPGEMGRGVLSRGSCGNRVGYAGYQHAPELVGAKWHVRHRVLESELGRWTRRDPIGYLSYVTLLEYVNGNPLHLVDSSGLFSDGYLCYRTTANIRGCWACCLPRNEDGTIAHGPPDRRCLEDCEYYWRNDATGGGAWNSTGDNDLFRLPPREIAPIITPGRNGEAEFTIIDIPF